MAESRFWKELVLFQCLGIDCVHYLSYQTTTHSRRAGMGLIHDTFDSLQQKIHSDSFFASFSYSFLLGTSLHQQVATSECFKVCEFS